MDFLAARVGRPVVELRGSVVRFGERGVRLLGLPIYRPGQILCPREEPTISEGNQSRCRRMVVRKVAGFSGRKSTGKRIASCEDDHSPRPADGFYGGDELSRL